MCISISSKRSPNINPSACGKAGSIYLGEHGTLRFVDAIPFPNSVGILYSNVTSALGFVPDRHEGKIVGLAAYGDPEVLGPILRSRFVMQNGGFRILETNNVYFARLLASQFPKIDVAAAYQRVLEEVAVAYVSQHLRKTGLRKLVREPRRVRHRWPFRRLGGRVRHVRFPAAIGAPSVAQNGGRAPGTRRLGDGGFER